MVRQNRVLLPLLFFSVFLIVVSKIKMDQKFNWPYPKLTDLVATENYMSDLGALFLGAHRVAGDLCYIQFLQYYGTPSELTEKEQAELEAKHLEHEGGHYPKIKEFGLRLIHLDPFF